MPANYGKHATTTPQTRRAPGKNQVKNYAGGYVFKIDQWQQLDRFLVLGTEGGTFYASENKITTDNIGNILKCIHEDGKRVVRRCHELSDQGRIYKNDTAIFVLALVFTHGDTDAKIEARKLFNGIIRIPTHLFTFAEYAGGMRGWGQSMMKAVAGWYENSPIERLEYHVAKYQQRNGWSNRDMLRLSHPKTKDETRSKLYNYITKGGGVPGEFELLEAMRTIHTLPENKESLSVINQAITHYGLTHEMLPTWTLAKQDTWEALLEKMPMTAMIRNLGRMSSLGLFQGNDKWDKIDRIVSQLKSEEAIKRARIHPMTAFIARKVYSAGHGVKGNLAWDVEAKIVKALEKAFELSFVNTEKTGKKYLFAIDSSGSMMYGSMPTIPGLTTHELAVAMAYVTGRTEGYVDLVKYDHNIYERSVSPDMTLQEFERAAGPCDGGATDCALPFQHALRKGMVYDGIVLFTDNETWSGGEHVFQTVEKYRKNVNPEMRAVSDGFVANHNDIFDKKDHLSMNVVGFSPDVPKIITDFVACRI